MKKILALLLLSVVSMSAHADWGQVGAAALCSPDGQSFELMSTLETSGWGDVPPPNAHSFPVGTTQKYKCNVNGNLVTLVITVESPGNGMGEGGGVIFIDKLMVNKLTLLTNAYFNWSVSGEPELSRVVIKRSKHGLTEQLCYAADISDPPSKTRCKTKEISGF